MAEQAKRNRVPGLRMVKAYDLDCEVKADFAKREITGYASVFDVLDSQGDIVRRGAFADTMVKHRKRIRMLWQHDTRAPIGLPVHMEEDTRGLLTVGRVAKTQLGDEALVLAAEGVVSSMSIGFDIVEATEFEDAELRATLRGYYRNAPMYNLTKLDLYEWSPVTFGANPEAGITSVRSELFGGWTPEVEASRLFSGEVRLAADDRALLTKLYDTMTSAVTDPAPISQPRSLDSWAAPWWPIEAEETKSDDTDDTAELAAFSDFISALASLADTTTEEP